MTDQNLLIKQQKELVRLRQKASRFERLNSVHAGMGKQIKETISLLSATLDATADGLLITDVSRKITKYNRKLLKLLRVPASLARHNDDIALTAFCSEQVKDPVEFTGRILHLYSHPDEESFDILEFKDGRVFERYSKPLKLGKTITGRVWSFRDISIWSRAEKAFQESEEQFRMILNSTAEAIYGIDIIGNCTFCNSSFLRQMRFEREEDLLGRNMHDLIHYKKVDGTPYPQEECRGYLVTWKGEGVHVDDEVFWRSDGSSFYVEYWSYPIKRGDEIIGTVVTFLDISDRKRIENALRESEAKYRALFTKMLNGFSYHKIVLDEKGLPVDYIFLEVNDSFERLTGLDRKDILGKRATEILPGLRGSDFDWIRVYGEVALTCKEIRFEQFSSDFDRWFAVSAYCTEKGYFGAILEDITERKRMEQAIKEQAYLDTLTGLPNRMLFMEHLNLAINQARRNEQVLAVLFLDLDRFKPINDAFGHATGDQVLKQVASRLKSCVRDTDMVTRIGGDEFSILLPNVDQIEDISKVTEKIISTVNKPYMLNEHELHISASVGISTYPDDSIRPEILLRNADIAMYHAKGQGSGNYQFYSPVMKARTIERMRFESSLRKALDRKEIMVYFQPQIDILTGELVCAEALVRWQHPEFGLLAPVQFIPLAENTGLINSIGEYVLHTACEQKKAWQRAGYPSFCVAVNLSVHEFQSPLIVERILGTLKNTGLEPHFLELEITEGTAMRDIALSSEKMEQLSETGIRFSLDDFGTGYSSLSYLKKFPIRKLKIDRSFISGLKENTDDRAIVHAVIALAHSLELSVVAEGVETDEQMSFLRSCRCDQMQGFLYSKPLPAEDFQKMIPGARAVPAAGIQGK
jgi:diguanylate cyclase (GGDEF)-like protein/PAS domain S-box-containing protein